MTHLRKMMLEELQRRNYSEDTTRFYIRIVEDFSRRFNRPPDRLGPRHIREYQAELFQKRKLSPGTVAHHLSALRVFWHQDAEEELERRRDSLSETTISPSVDPQSGRSRTTHRRGAHSLPSHSVDDTLRRWNWNAEMTHLKVSDIDSKQMVIHIQGGKGRVDRDVMLSPKLLEELREHWLFSCRENPANGCFQAIAGTVVVSRSIPKHLGTPASKRPSERASRKRYIHTS